MFSIWGWENFKWRTKIIFNMVLFLGLIFWTMMFFGTDLYGTFVTLFKVLILALIWNWFSRNKSVLFHMGIILIVTTIVEMTIYNMN